MSRSGVSLYPFEGIRFSGDLCRPNECVAPPYDLFDYGDPIYNYLKNFENNIVDIQKPEGEGDEKYFEANRIFQEMKKRQILIKDKSPYYYLYEQITGYGKRLGVIAACEVDDSYQFIRRHEKIKKGPKVDRLKLTLATGLNVGLIFTILKDDQGTLNDYLLKLTLENRPVLEFDWPIQKKQDSGEIDIGLKKTLNKLYLIQDDYLQKLLSNRILYIADGHHRYQTMIEYRDLMRIKYGHTNGNKNDFEKTLIFAAPDKDLLVLGYHRIVKNITNGKVDNFFSKINEEFEVLGREEDKLFIPEKKGQIGVYFKNQGFLIRERQDKSIPGQPGSGSQNVADLLDTSILQNKIMGHFLGIDEEMVKSGNFITYPNGEEKVGTIKGLVDNNSHQIAFTLYPTSVYELMEVADRQLVLPQKSTYFHPKLLTGLVLNQVAPPSMSLDF